MCASVLTTGGKIRSKHALADVIAKASRLSQQFPEEDGCILMLYQDLFVGNGSGQWDVLGEDLPVTPPPVVIWEEREVEPLARPQIAVRVSHNVVVNAAYGEEELTAL